MKYQKPATSINKQIEILRDRGLIIEDESFATKYLSFVGYFRLMGYALPFQVNYNNDGSHKFLDGITFENVINSYQFDRDLRLITIDALEQIEVAIRVSISQSLSEKFGSHWHSNKDLFVNPQKHLENLLHIKKEIGHDDARKPVRQIFINHYYQKYSEPELPPSWMIFEVLSLGTLSKIYKNLKRDHQKSISKIYNLDPKVFSSWLHSLSYVRNLAAHHQRLWNKVYTIKPVIPNNLLSLEIDQTRFYAQAVVIVSILRVLGNEGCWINALKELFAKNNSVEIFRLGFPKNWEIQSIWTQ
jgi:abortive infection bacteriophage resistance protein